MRKLLTASALVCCFLTAGFTSTFAQQDKEVTWYTMEEAQQYAEEQQKKVLIYAEAQWCGYCKKMNKEVFPKEVVQDSIQKYYFPVRIDVESDKKIVFNGESMTQQQFAHRQQVRSTPTIFFVDNSGEILGMQPGYMPVDVFNKLLSYVGSGAFGNVSFEEYLPDKN